MTKVQGMVSLDEACYCALVHAFLRNREQVSRWAGSLGGRFKTFTEIFSGSRRLAFSPTLEMAAFYGAFARAEIARLGKDRPGLLCSHPAELHKQVLSEFLEKLPRMN